MAQTQQHSLSEAQLTGFKYFKKILPLFEHLHEVGCGRDKAQNRTLHFDQYCALNLLWFIRVERILFDEVQGS